MPISSEISKSLMARLLSFISSQIKLYIRYPSETKMLSFDKPIIVIVGATGTGKSKLAIEIAEKFNGEIISADSMQVYKSLDIVTNKVTSEELRTAPVHHLLSYVDPLIEPSYTVVDFRNTALPIYFPYLEGYIIQLNRILADDKLPVIVGGTNYYIESLLWKVLVSENVKDGLTADTDSIKLLDKSNKELHDQLKRLDPEMAKLIHPNDRRKILRSLQVFEQNGRRHSTILEEQQSLKGGSDLGGPLRYPKSCLLWLQCEQDVLNQRLDKRVDDMLERGLLTELDDFHRRYNGHRLENGIEPDYTKGIFQSIGFKEFHSYLILPSDVRGTPQGLCMLREGVDRLKLVTRRYARVQLKWITSRFIQCRHREVPPIFPLNATKLETWDDHVAKPAIEIVTSLLKGVQSPSQPLDIDCFRASASTATNRRETIECDLCQVVVKGHDQWKAHLRSKKHRSFVRHAKQLAEMQKNNITAECVQGNYVKKNDFT